MTTTPHFGAEEGARKLRFNGKPFTTFWLDLDREHTLDCTDTEMFAAEATKLWHQDPITAAKVILAALTLFLDAIAQGIITEQTAARKSQCLFEVLLDESICRMLRGTENGAYALAAFSLDQAWHSHKTLGHSHLFSGYYSSLDKFTRAAVPFVSTPFTLRPVYDPRPCQQMAQRLMLPEWCMLVEPDLNSTRDIVAAIWVARPSLHPDYAEYDVEYHPFAVILPDSH